MRLLGEHVGVRHAPEDEQRADLLRRLGHVRGERVDHLDRALAGVEHERDGHVRSDRVQPVLERGDDAEVAAAAAERPEELLMLVLRGTHDVAVRGDDHGCDEVVDGEAVRPAEPAHAAGERQRRDPGLRDDAERHREAVLLRGPVDVAEAAPAPGAHDSALDVDLDVAQLREVDDHRAVADRVPGDAVPAAAHGDGKLVLAREADGLDHVGRPGDADDERRPAVDHAVPDAARLVVPGVAGPDHQPVDPCFPHGDLVGGEDDLAPLEGLHRLRHVVLLRMAPTVVATRLERQQGGEPNHAGAAATMAARCAGTSSRRSAAR
jgi:hypothetical protein